MRFKRILVIALSLLLLMITLLISSMVVVSPPISQMRSGPLTMTRWEKKRGKVNVQVSPHQAEWLKLEKVSFHTIHAILTAEDARFFMHHGVDPREIYQSILHNWEKGRYARGASTITQQVVKLLFLENDKTLLRKFRETSGALLLELMLDKNAILEWYLNIVDFGSGVYGIDQAAQFYFATPPELLTIPQSILLASVIPSPNRWSDSLRNKALTTVGHQRFLSILSRMRSEGFINKTQCRIALLTGNFGSPIHWQGPSPCE